MKNRVIEIDEIKQIIPHRHPFLLVDRVISINDEGANPDEPTIRGIKNVTANEDFFNGHFPNYPVMPGVLIIESLAQLSGIYSILKLKEEGAFQENSNTFFTSLNNVKFKKQVRPGDQLILESTFVKKKMGVWWFTCRALVDNEEVVVAELSAALR